MMAHERRKPDDVRFEHRTILGPAGGRRTCPGAVPPDVVLPVGYARALEADPGRGGAASVS
jgi:hypothetical protein